jgi:hypothetical protein
MHFILQLQDMIQNCIRTTIAFQYEVTLFCILNPRLCITSKIIYVSLSRVCIVCHPKDLGENIRQITPVTTFNHQRDPRSKTQRIVNEKELS